MGFHDAAWAYTLDLPMAQKSALVALCHASDDVSHETILGQVRLAAMVGSSVETVRRALSALEAAGIISRARRSRATGYRSSDRTTVNVDWTPAYRSESQSGSLSGSESESLPGNVTGTESVTLPTGQSAYKAESDGLPVNLRDLTPLSEGAISDQPEDQPEDQPVVGRTKRGTRIPDDFTVTASMVDWARENVPLVDGKRSTDRFVNYFQAKTGRDATKLDWERTWRNWLLKDQEDAERRPASRPPPMTRAQQTLALAHRFNDQKELT